MPTRGNTTNTTPKSNTNLPSWANVRPCSSDETAGVTSTKQSERLLRIDSALQWHTKLSQAQRKAWKETVLSMLKEVERGTRRARSTSQSDASATSSEDVSAKGSLTALEQRYAFPAIPSEARITEAPGNPSNNSTTSYPWELLPTTVVSPSPSCRIDRHALSEALWEHYYSNGVSASTIDAQPCLPILLPKIMSSLSATLHILWRQCWQAEPEKALKEFLQVSHLGKNHHQRTKSLVQVLTEWARQTLAFKSIHIILEDIGNIHNNNTTGVLSQLVAIFLEWRERHGIPISWTVVLPPGQQQQLSFQRIFQHEYGWKMRLVHVQPSTDVWMTAFWNELRGPSPSMQSPSALFVLPIMFHGNSPERHFASTSHFWKTLIEEFLLEHRSCAKFCSTLQQAVTSFYESTPGSFVWDAMASRSPLKQKGANFEDHADPQHATFLAWFSTYGTAKRWLNRSGGEGKGYQLQKCFQIQNQSMRWWWQWHCTFVNLVLIGGTIYSRGQSEGLITPNKDQNFPSANATSKLPHSKQKLLERLLPLVSLLTTQQQLTQPISGGDDQDCEREEAGVTDKEIDENLAGFPEVLTQYLLSRAPTNSRNANKSSDGKPLFNEELSPPQVQAKNLLFELILLIDQLPEESVPVAKDEASDAKVPSTDVLFSGLWKMMWDVVELTSQAMAALLDEWVNTNPMIPSSVKADFATKTGDRKNTSTCFGTSVPLRQDVVHGLASPSKELYELMQDCLSISREDWMYDFGGSTMDFAHGVWTLIVLGLVQSKVRPRRKGQRASGIVYEKVSVVW